MATLEQNFQLLTALDENVAVVIQSALRLIDDNTATKITLANPDTDAQTVEFTIDQGSIDDLKMACDYKNITISGNKLSV